MKLAPISVFCLALFAAGWLEPHASAEAPALRLEVPADCRAQALALAEQAFPAGVSGDDVSLAVERTGERYRAQVDTKLGTRTLEGESCAAAVSAGLVFVALSTAPSREAALSMSEPVAEPAAATLGAPARRVSQPDRPHVDERSLEVARQPLVVRASGVGMWSTGALPGGGFGGGVEASLGKPWWHATAGLHGWGERDVSASVAGTGGKFWLWSGLAAGCFAPPLGRVRPAACAGLELGRMHGEGRGVMRTYHARALWAAVLARAELRVEVVAGLELLVLAQPELSLVRRRFRLEGAGVVHQPDKFAFSAGLGVAYEFSSIR